MNYLKAFHLLKARRSDVVGKQGLAYLNAFGGINKIFTVCENSFSKQNLQVKGLFDLQLVWFSFSTFVCV